MESVYREQVELLIRCLPEVEKQTCFALKGGTAINLFVRDMPRLSVDIDLVYLPIEPREQTLANIENALNNIGSNIELYVTGSAVTKTVQENHVNKLLVKHGDARIIIEPNVVQCGAIFEIEEHTLCERAEVAFEASVTANIISMAELYGSKIVAALDRQHPRDLFDVKLLLENEGITEDTRKAFVIYLASHSRPMSELLNPNMKDISQEFITQFQGITDRPVKLADLLDIREQLVKHINTGLTEQERQFLLSIKSGRPNWSLIDIPQIDRLPAIQWKLQNIAGMEKKKHQEAIEKLKSALGL